ncbi:protein of unknown function [Paenibacillus alvei]|uniref:Uncharacterized protein n=1 Tax=Paenibacillus alvei TaxID=44250 RepID=A0A383RJC7_PAEAL|nr:protein of unknown function [Paenibacillus alvei]
MCHWEWKEVVYLRERSVLRGRDGVWLMILSVMSNIIEVIFVERELLHAEFHCEMGNYDVQNPIICIG